MRVDGPATDLEIIGNRFYNLDAAVSFARIAEGNVVKAQVIGNTVYAARAGVLFDMPTPRMGPPPGKFDLVLSQNYFALTRRVWERTTGDGPIPGVTAADNARAPDSEDGNVPLHAAPLAAPPPTPGPGRRRHLPPLPRRQPRDRPGEEGRGPVTDPRYAASGEPVHPPLAA